MNVRPVRVRLHDIEVANRFRLLVGFGLVRVPLSKKSNVFVILAIKLRSV